MQSAPDPEKPQCVKLSMAALPQPLGFCMNDDVLTLTDPTRASVSVCRNEAGK